MGFLLNNVVKKSHNKIKHEKKMKLSSINRKYTHQLSNKLIKKLFL